MAGPVRQVSHAQALQLILDAGLAAGAVGFQLFQAESQVFAHDGKDDLVFGILKHEADPSPHGFQVLARIQPIHADPARGRQGQAVEQARQRALAGAVRADDADAALCQRQAEPAQHLGLRRGNDHLVKLD